MEDLEIVKKMASVAAENGSKDDMTAIIVRR